MEAVVMIFVLQFSCPSIISFPTEAHIFVSLLRPLVLLWKLKHILLVLRVYRQRSQSKDGSQRHTTPTPLATQQKET